MNLINEIKSQYYETFREEYKAILNGVDLVGFELVQNIAKQLNERKRKELLSYFFLIILKH